MKKTVLGFIGIVLMSLLSADCTTVQRRTPRRIVGMDYPLLARAARIEGQVEVVCTINPDGSVTSTKATGNPHPILAKAAQENASRWTFIGGSGTEHSPETATLVYSFKIEENISEPVDPTVSFHHPARQFIFEYPFFIKIRSEYCPLESSCF